MKSLYQVFTVRGESTLQARKFFTARASCSSLRGAKGNKIVQFTASQAFRKGLPHCLISEKGANRMVRAVGECESGELSETRDTTELTAPCQHLTTI